MDDHPASAIHASQLALGRALRQLRQQAGLTQRELADRAGADDTYISQVETGRRDIRWSTITRLLNALDASIALAHQLADLPQFCLRSDRMSALEQWGLSEEEAAVNEATASPTINPSSEVATSERSLPRRMNIMKLR